MEAEASAAQHRQTPLPAAAAAAAAAAVASCAAATAATRATTSRRGQRHTPVRLPMRLPSDLAAAIRQHRQTPLGQELLMAEAAALGIVMPSIRTEGRATPLSVLSPRLEPSPLQSAGHANTPSPLPLPRASPAATARPTRELAFTPFSVTKDELKSRLASVNVELERTLDDLVYLRRAKADADMAHGEHMGRAEAQIGQLTRELEQAHVEQTELQAVSEEAVAQAEQSHRAAAELEQQRAQWHADTLAQATPPHLKCPIEMTRFRERTRAALLTRRRHQHRGTFSSSHARSDGQRSGPMLAPAHAHVRRRALARQVL
jgi:hypothetical protein